MAKATKAKRPAAKRSSAAILAAAATDGQPPSGSATSQGLELSAAPPKNLREPAFDVESLTWATRKFIKGLTPSKMLSIFETASRYIDEQIQLAHELEESDDHLRGTLKLRRAAVLRMDVTVESGDDEDERANQAAALADKIVRQPWFYQASDALLRACFLQWSAVEILYGDSPVWRRDPATRKAWMPIGYRPVEPQRWHFNERQRPEFYKSLSGRGETLAPAAGQFMLHGPETTATPGDFAVVRAVALLVYFGKLDLKQWGTQIDQWGIPVIRMTYADGLSREQVQTIVSEMLALAGRRVIATPQGTTVETDEVPEQLPHETAQNFCRRAISRLLLGQDSSQMAIEGQKTGATLQGNVRDDIRDADALLLDASQNETFLAPWCAWNFGPDVAPPRIVRVPPEKSLDAGQADTISKVLIQVREGKLHPDAARELLYAAGVPEARVDAMVDAQPVGKDDKASELAFKREIVKAFVLDGTIGDVMYNATNVQQLLEDVGVETEPDYEEPWVPIVAQPGGEVTGNPVKDAEGDIVGSTVEPSADAAMQAAPASGTDGAQPPVAAIPAAGGTVTPGVAAVADTGLNGAQIDALREILDSVAQGQQSPVVALEIIQAAFPTIPVERVQRMVAAAEAFTPTNTGETPVPQVPQAPSKAATVAARGADPTSDSAVTAASNVWGSIFKGHTKQIRALAEEVAAGDGSDAEKLATFQRRLPELLDAFEVKERAALLAKAQLAALGRGVLDMHAAVTAKKK